MLNKTIAKSESIKTKMILKIKKLNRTHTPSYEEKLNRYLSAVK